MRSEYYRRIEIMLLADSGHSQTQICVRLGCSQETARYWIEMARSGKAHQWDDCPIGRPQTINEPFLERLKELVSHSPREFGYPFKRWTAGALSKHLANEFGIEVSDRHINRLLKRMGLSTRANHSEATVEPEQVKDGIIIRDLQPVAPPNLLLPLNPMQTSN
jgi:putative transposase